MKKVWQLNGTTKKSLNTLSHGGLVFTLVHVREQIIASGGGEGDYLIKIWDINNSNYLHSLKNHTGCVWDLLMYNCDCGVLMSVSMDKCIRLWVVQTVIPNSTENRCINTEREMTSCLQLTKTIVAAGTLGTVDFWNIETSQLIMSLIGHSGWIRQIVRLSPILIGSCSDDKTIRIWDLESMTERKTLNGQTNSVYGLLRLCNSKLVSMSYDKTIRVWESSN